MNDVRRCPHCNLVLWCYTSQFDQHVKRCKGKTKPGPAKRRDHPAKAKDKRRHNT